MWPRCVSYVNVWCMHKCCSFGHASCFRFIPKCIICHLESNIFLGKHVPRPSASPTLEVRTPKKGFSPSALANMWFSYFAWGCTPFVQIAGAPLLSAKLSWIQSLIWLNVSHPWSLKSNQESLIYQDVSKFKCENGKISADMNFPSGHLPLPL